MTNQARSRHRSQLHTKPASHDDRRSDESAPLLTNHGAANRIRDDYGAASSAPSGEDVRDDDDDADAGDGNDNAIEHEMLQRKRAQPTPLPWLQLSVLCLMRMTEPISFTVIFPFVTQMLHENLPDVAPERLGYYAGLVESTFAFVQFLTILFWCRLSDAIGRKPVLLVGLLGSFLSVNCFGLSRSFAQMVLARSILGLMNGNIAVIKSMLAEITDDSNQARAFALLPMCFAAGSVVGPTLGGWLAHPVETFPAVFGGSAFLETHPFWLPCAVAAFLNLLAILLGFLCLDETLPRKERKSILPECLRRRRRHRRSRADSSDNDDGHRDPESHPSSSSSSSSSGAKPTLRSLMTKQVSRVLGTQFCLNFLNACYAAILPLFCYETVRHGGLGWSNVDIGTFLAFNGVVGVVNQVLFFPWLERRWGSPMLVYRRVTVVFPLVFVALPLAHAVAGAYPGRGWPPVVVMACGTLVKSFANMSIVCSVILVNNTAPSRQSLGTLNGVSQMFGCLSRTIGPTVSTSLFAFSISNRRILDGQLVWICLVLFATATWYLTTLVQAPTVAAWRVREQRKRAGQDEGDGHDVGSGRK
ncbi:uncharacterized protein PFL1_02451 [Pseudozyma flocculosa PF-1]|uniref:Major facilitator superfamily (MFS) profile domain-containing protein n=2 Tax=Pseudozyma flocculosa TaxID=84751 RepID=A0A5C3EZ56_9BASI|nr:uncharacterized protein PFL1_02451 [Pseudozyma flocculosa PF-1]EPQ29778.1 hypothetical protein PFL1_02451 [Pseudozyma flocculosa PF-1]SPO37065.1 uncharacterized protein PSFLO_02537 [Pseudozyma flocculosa]